jgi:hypothetical protein
MGHHRLRAAAGLSPADPYFSSTSLLLLGNGTNGGQNNTFVDSSTNNFTITRFGNTTQGSFSPFTGAGGSGYFDGSGDYLNFTGITLSGDFCCECWYYRTANSTNYSTIFGGSSSGANANNHQFAITNTGGITLVLSSTAVITNAGTAFVNNAWNHVAYVRNGTNCAVFVNGVRQGTGTSSISTSVCSRIADVAGLSGYQPFGYISNARIVSGSSVYDPTATTFTPPTSPLTAVTNTSLLLNFTNGSILDSTGKNDLETVGDAQISTSVKQFGTGSLKFDGTGDYLKAPATVLNDFGSGNFTVEFWLYTGAFTNAYITLYENNYATSPNLTFQQNGSTGVMSVYINGASVILTSSNADTTGSWVHYAAVRNGTSVVLYRNGTSVASSTYSGNVGNTAVPLYIGGSPNGGGTYNLNGYIDDLRITKGVARYTSAFTPPSAQLPAR